MGQKNKIWGLSFKKSPHIGSESSDAPLPRKDGLSSPVSKLSAENLWILTKQSLLPLPPAGPPAPQDPGGSAAAQDTQRQHASPARPGQGLLP